MAVSYLGSDNPVRLSIVILRQKDTRKELHLLIKGMIAGCSSGQMPIKSKSSFNLMVRLVILESSALQLSASITVF